MGRRPGQTRRSTSRSATSSLREKVLRLRKAFPSQAARDWFDDDVFVGLARLRGMECRATYAEAFTAGKAVLAW